MNDDDTLPLYANAEQDRCIKSSWEYKCECYEPPYMTFTKPEPYKRDKPKIPRNGLCPCRSGKKYKKCCMNQMAEEYNCTYGVDEKD